MTIEPKQQKYIEYTQAANIQMPQILPNPLIDNHNQLTLFDFAKQLQTPYPATSPNCLVGFINLDNDQTLKCQANATSHIFVIVEGQGYSENDEDSFNWQQGDVVTFAGASPICHRSKSKSKLYWVNDSPLLNYLGVIPARKQFKSCHYPFQEMIQYVEYYNNQANAQKRNRNGVLLASEECLLTQTITPSLWSLYNVLPANTVQLPHRHNSVALDLCLLAPQKGCYTLMSPNIDLTGQLISPERLDWLPGQAFVTPPGWWHSHHNVTNEKAVVFPVQDAGLHTYLRTLFIEFKC